MIITAVFGILIGSTVTFFKTNVLKTNANPEKFDEFLEVYDELMNNYYEELDGDELIESGIRGMLDYLEDNYSEYLDERETNALMEELNGEFSGLGVTITTNDKGEVYIISIIADSPAERAHFEVGDVFLEVDGINVDGYTPDDLSKLIKGKTGTKSTIKVRRGDDLLDITFTRGKVEIASVASELRDGNVGYIVIGLFARNTREQLEKAIFNLQAQGAKYFVIDVRDNSGGLLTSAEEISELFLNRGDVIYQLSSHDGITSVTATSEKAYSLKMAILVNSNSASGAEIFAAALNENLGVPLVGTKTFGKGSVQITKGLSNGSLIKYTIQEWLTPKGNHVNKIGITPTYEVNIEGNVDTQYNKAVEILKK
jgi:carboxyl-terminal processing protease